MSRKPKKAITSKVSLLPKAASSTWSSSASSKAGRIYPAKPTSSAKAPSCKSWARSCWTCAKTPDGLACARARQAGEAMAKPNASPTSKASAAKCSLWASSCASSDPDTLQAVREALDVQRNGSAKEPWPCTWPSLARPPVARRCRRWASGSTYPDTDIQQLRALVRQARKDACPTKPPCPKEAPRQGRAYRDIFQAGQKRPHMAPAEHPRLTMSDSQFDPVASASSPSATAPPAACTKTKACLRCKTGWASAAQPASRSSRA
jgi:ribosome-associated protein